MESALFGTTGRQGQTSIQSPGGSTTGTVNISRERLNQLRRPCPVLNNDQKRELQRKALEDAGERMLREARRGSNIRASSKPVEVLGFWATKTRVDVEQVTSVLVCWTKCILVIALPFVSANPRRTRLWLSKRSRREKKLEDELLEVHWKTFQRLDW